MENATQALIMAGGILIAILIIAVIVTLYITFSNSSEGISSNFDVTELNKFNTTFIVYEGRKDITAQEIVTLINLSQQRNYEVKIIITTKTGTIKQANRDWTNASLEQLNQFLNDHILINSKDNAGVDIYQNTFSYVNNSIQYAEDGRVCEIRFTEN